MELRELSSFVAVAEELHFGRAAARLHVSQPALSQQIKRLEAELGCVLVDRDSRNAALTPAGQAFLGRCRQLLAEVDEAVDEVRRIGSGLTGHLEVGYVGSTLYGVVPQLVARFRSAAPDVELTLTERKTAQQIEALLNGTQGVGFIHLPGSLPSALATRVLAQEQLQLAIPTFDARAGEEGPVKLGDLGGVPLVLFPRRLEPDTYDRIMEACTADGLVPTVVQEATGLHTILGLVAAGVGCAFVTDEVAGAVRQPGITFRPIIDAPPIVTALAWCRTAKDPVMIRFLDEAGLDAREAGP